jgi:hypothetical protein
MMVTLSVALSAQNENSTDTLKKDFKIEPFVRLGFDVSAIGRTIYEPEVRQLEVSVDSELLKNWFFNLEAGMMQVSSDQETFSYSSNGYFLRTGVDVNILGRPDAGQNDLVLLGLRYAWSFLQHEAPFYFLENPYWGEHSGSIEQTPYHTHWMELTGGVRTEVFTNLFLGWTLRTKIPLYRTRNPEIEPYFIPGFAHGKRSSPLTVHFSVYYRFGL